MLSGLPLGLALVSGLNTYLPLFLLALFARYAQSLHVSPHFAWLVSDQALVILGVLAVCEILAEKFPVLDHVWDFLHTLLRPVAGALAAGASLGSNQVLEIILTMLLGGTLATAAHSVKSSLRLVSTTKSLGIANPILSLGEDILVVIGTLLSVYAPWVMLGVVGLFVLISVAIGPWLLRTLSFDLRILAAWLRWLGRWILRVPAPQSLRESLLELDPDYLKSLSEQLEPGEELRGALTGWKRSRRGPRRAALLVTPRRLLLIEHRLWRRARPQAIPLSEVVMARCRSLGPFARLEILSRHNESFVLSLRKTHAALGALAAQDICRLAGLASPPDGPVPSSDPRLGSARH